MNIDAGMGLDFDCRLYPNTIAFKGYPLNLYQVCTLETKIFLSYKGLSSLLGDTIDEYACTKLYTGISLIIYQKKHYGTRRLIHNTLNFPFISILKDIGVFS